LSKSLEEHLKAYSKDVIDIKKGEIAIEINKIDNGFKIKTNKGEYEAKTILIATGSVRRKLQIKGAEQFENKGITYCATCDAPFFEGMDVAVIGGGNAAFETALQLADVAKSVTILQRSKFKADQVTIDKVLSNPKVKSHENLELLEIKGDKFVSQYLQR
jgi:thioredoxin reductase